ncbi:MAG TPA: nucleotidyltransferase family protein [Thermoanaerobaculia bacterium]
MPRPLRFRPPRLALSPEARWMLLRAFGPAGAPFPKAVDPAAALAMARRFEVSARIAVRQGRERLRAEVGEETAAEYARDRARAAAVGMRLMGEARRVAEVAAGLGCPLACLKFAALEGTGLLAAGSRGACDVDLLAPGDRAEELWRALAAAGFRGSGMPEAEHQLPALAGPQGGVVEIHRHLPGVRLEGAASASFEALDRAGLLLPLPDLPGRCVAPAPEVLAAHGLVHGLGQHGYWPSSYSLLKMVADLLDLGSLTDRAAAWVARDVSDEEASAVRRLLERLAAGEDPAGWEGPEEELLRHILAGRLDEEYAGALRLGLFRPQPSERSRPAQLARAVLGAVLLSDAQIDAVYGRPRTRLGYLGRRLARPFDLLLRLGSYGVRWVRLRRER